MRRCSNSCTRHRLLDQTMVMHTRFTLAICVFVHIWISKTLLKEIQLTALTTTHMLRMHMHIYIDIFDLTTTIKPTRNGIRPNAMQFRVNLFFRFFQLYFSCVFCRQDIYFQMMRNKRQPFRVQCDKVERRKMIVMRAYNWENFDIFASVAHRSAFPIFHSMSCGHQFPFFLFAFVCVCVSVYAMSIVVFFTSKWWAEPNKAQHEPSRKS